MLTDKFQIKDKVCIITGGAGLLGKCHVEAVLEGGGIPVLLGRTYETLCKVKEEFYEKYHKTVEIYQADVTHKEVLINVREDLMKKYGHIDILINNAANNPKVEDNVDNFQAVKFINFPKDIWEKDINVGLTGYFFCCQVFGEVMEVQKKGVILNISSDYGILAPDQRLYQKANIPMEEQIIKPITYSVVKHAIIGLTKYLAAYWGESGIRVNTLCPSGIYNNQDEEFLKKYIYNIPMGRMSVPDDYPGTILYMISEASSFLNGATIVIDGGKSIW